MNSNWIATQEQEPPKDRLVLVTNGISWYREDEHKEPILYNDKEVIPKRHYLTLWELGSVYLVYWKASTLKDLAPGYWKEFGSNSLGPLEFTYWMEFSNPLPKEDSEFFNYSETVPDIHQLTPYHHSNELVKIKQKLRI